MRDYAPINHNIHPPFDETMHLANMHQSTKILLNFYLTRNLYSLSVAYMRKQLKQVFSLNNFITNAKSIYSFSLELPISLSLTSYCLRPKANGQGITWVVVQVGFFTPPSLSLTHVILPLTLSSYLSPFFLPLPRTYLTLPTNLTLVTYLTLPTYLTLLTSYLTLPT